MMCAAAATNLISSLSLNPTKTLLPKPIIILSPNHPFNNTTNILLINKKIPSLSQQQQHNNNNNHHKKGGENIMYFKSGYNMQLAVDERWTEKELIDAFNKMSAKFGIKRECYRRRFFENPRDKAIRKLRHSIRRRQSFLTEQK